MAQSVFEQAGDRIAETAHDASRAASVVTDAVEDGVEPVRHVARQSGYAAAEFLDDAKKRVKRNPIETVVVTFAVCILLLNEL
jgi:hypothetical protein